MAFRQISRRIAATTTSSHSNNSNKLFVTESFVVNKRNINKVYASAEEAVEPIKDGQKLYVMMISTFTTV